MELSLGAKVPLEDLYQSKILEFARIARKTNLLDNPTVRFTLKNPICGDEVTVDLSINKNYKITNYGHNVKGCALCEASAGLLSNNIIGVNAKEASKINDNLISWLKSEKDEFIFSGLKNFIPVRKFQNRYRCVSLSFEAFSQACNKYLEG